MQRSFVVLNDFLQVLDPMRFADACEVATHELSEGRVKSIHNAGCFYPLQTDVLCDVPTAEQPLYMSIGKLLACIRCERRDGGCSSVTNATGHHGIFLLLYDKKKQYIEDLNGKQDFR